MKLELPDLRGAVLGGRYRLHSLLGRGGMGAVYAAEQLGLGRRVAVKVVLPALSNEPTPLERFRREAELTARLGHPNIVQVTDFGHEPGEPAWLVMELLEGRSLRDESAQGPLDPELVRVVGLQALSALEAVHSTGVVHRDLKPDNLYLVRLAGGGVLVKLLDFGIARLTEAEAYAKLTATGALVGTPNYMAPEQLLGSALDARADLWSLGVTLFRALTGELPFRVKGMEALVRAILQAPIPSVRELCPSAPEPLVAAIDGALQRDPAHRFPNARAMREALLAQDRMSALPFAPKSAPAPIPSLTSTVTPAFVKPVPASALVTAPPTSATLPPPAASSKKSALLVGAGVLAVLGLGVLQQVLSSALSTHFAQRATQDALEEAQERSATLQQAAQVQSQYLLAQVQAQAQAYAAQQSAALYQQQAAQQQAVMQQAAQQPAPSVVAETAHLRATHLSQQAAPMGLPAEQLQRTCAAVETALTRCLEARRGGPPRELSVGLRVIAQGPARAPLVHYDATPSSEERSLRACDRSVGESFSGSFPTAPVQLILNCAVRLEGR